MLNKIKRFLKRLIHNDWLKIAWAIVVLIIIIATFLGPLISVAVSAK